MSQTMKEALKELAVELPDNGNETGVEKTLFMIKYRLRGELHTKLFLHQGNRKSAIERAQQHCTVAGYKFIFCEHAIHDLDLEEAKILSGE